MSNTTYTLGNIKELTLKAPTSVNTDGIIDSNVISLDGLTSGVLILEVLSRTAGQIGVNSMILSNDSSFATIGKTFAKNQQAPNSLVDSSEYFIPNDYNNINVNPFDQAVLSAVGKTAIRFETSIVNVAPQQYKYAKFTFVTSGGANLQFSARVIATTNKEFNTIA